MWQSDWLLIAIGYLQIGNFKEKRRIINQYSKLKCWDGALGVRGPLSWNLPRIMDLQEAAEAHVWWSCFLLQVPRLLVSKVHSGSFPMLDSSYVNKTHSNDTTMWLQRYSMSIKLSNKIKTIYRISMTFNSKGSEISPTKTDPNFNLTAPKRLKDIVLIIV